MTTRQSVLAALDAVIDPELDEPITTLRFVSSVEVSADGDVEVMLRLPTPQCAPNFAFLMAADAREAVRRLPGVHGVRIVLEDHYTGTEINAALARGEGFAGAFPGETDDDDLESLRELFQRKALIARQSRLCETLLAGGADVDEIVTRCVADLEDGAELRRCLELRRRFGIPSGPSAPAFVLPNGDPLQPSDVQRWLRMGRLVRTGLETNGGICRSLLQFRHELVADPHEEVAR